MARWVLRGPGGEVGRGGGRLALTVGEHDGATGDGGGSAGDHGVGEVVPRGDQQVRRVAEAVAGDGDRGVVPRRAAEADGLRSRGSSAGRGSRREARCCRRGRRSGVCGGTTRWISSRTRGSSSAAFGVRRIGARLATASGTPARASAKLSARARTTAEAETAEVSARCHDTKRVRETWMAVSMRSLPEMRSDVGLGRARGGVADVAGAVAVGVFLVRVRDRRAVVDVVDHAIVVGVDVGDDPGGRRQRSGDHDERGRQHRSQKNTSPPHRPPFVRRWNPRCIPQSGRFGTT